ncbi:integrase catalytic domain-containing protein [Trichonephila clavipes]|nr:integrase catalytic domain-containing protein [Trichonephila clavipes]
MPPNRLRPIQDNEIHHSKWLSYASRELLHRPSLEAVEAGEGEEIPTLVDSYVEQNIIERVPNKNVVDGAEFYLPHKDIIRHDRSSSKLRIVFDASSLIRGSKFSLNDSLHIGPNFYPDLFELLLSFRKHTITFTVDIKQAVLNVELDDSYKNATNFFWTDSPESFSESLEVLRFNRVLFAE